MADLVEPRGARRRTRSTRGVVVVDRRRRGLPLALRRSLPAYASAIVAAEVLIAFVSPMAGALVDAAVVLVIANHHVALAAGAPGAEEPEDAGDVLPALALVPLLRLCSLCLPLADVPEAYWLLAMGAPVLLSAGIVARPGPLRIVWRSVLGAAGRSRRMRAAEARIAVLAGLALGLLAYALLEPRRPAPDEAFLPLVAASAGAFLVGGVLEELVFRGLLQRALGRALGGGGVALGCVLYAAVYLGTDSAAAFAFFALLGAVFAGVVERTGSLLGVSLAHGVLSLGLLVVWPLVLG